MRKPGRMSSGSRLAAVEMRRQSFIRTWYLDEAQQLEKTEGEKRTKRNVEEGERTADGFASASIKLKKDTLS